MHASLADWARLPCATDYLVQMDALGGTLKVLDHAFYGLRHSREPSLGSGASQHIVSKDELAVAVEATGKTLDDVQLAQLVKIVNRQPTSRPPKAAYDRIES